ncbi:MAG TPA: penicillin-binding protein 2 [Actinomycetota bacterium]|nr:penicillin-binding protein 2 [Actinomycetota bacterium]
MAQRPGTLGVDRVTLRLAVLGVLIVAAFVGLFSRLWFLQVLASEQYEELARENRVRTVQSEPPRGQILDRNGTALVRNRLSLAVTIDRQVVQGRALTSKVLRRLEKILEVPARLMRIRLNDATVSPYKPVVVATDITIEQANAIRERQNRFPGVTVQKVPLRTYPFGPMAAVTLGYVGEISDENLKSEHFKGAKPPYAPGDIVGKAGIEYFYDRLLRGTPQLDRMIVNSAGDVVETHPVRDENPGDDLYLSLDAGIQKVAEEALAAGLAAARSEFNAPAAAAVVMDPTNGEVLALASNPTYDPEMLADGISFKEFDSLGGRTPDDPDDDALLNRAIQAQRAPGSTFKVVTAGAALGHDIIDPYVRLECPGSAVYPPEGGPGSVLFRNWTSTYFGFIDLPTSLEISCDTFYYELGWRMEEAWGPYNEGDRSERFQKYMRMAGFGHETGIDLPNEADGVVPDVAWCKRNEDLGYCPEGWLPGYTVNMAIGQGALVVTPIQMAVTYSAIANGGTVWEPRLALKLVRNDEDEEEVVREFRARSAARLPLDPTEIAMIREGLERVVSGSEGTARGAFAGFPLDLYPIAGKTGTAERGETGLNDSWFVSYGPSDDPRYVVSVYVEEAGHGGETAAPIARQIWEGIFGLDKVTLVRLGQDFSG